MEHIVDLHIHSRFSRATSKNSTLEGLYFWAKLKGIHILGTGDFTHPAWFQEIRAKLVPAEQGLFRLQPDIAAEIDKTLPPIVRDQPVRFVPSVEIATIYKKGERVRKLHQLVILPSFESVSALNARLERIGNLKADGRPILGLDSKELLRHMLQVDPEGLYIPAHIWTPWFGMFGSKSGFDSIQEAFDDLAPHIRAIETGLSSDPAMNSKVGNLDGIAMTSHSDAHSPQKLGREATVVRAGLAYSDIIGAIKTNDDRLVGTIEFFPEEGKYHLDGHRACNVRLTPSQTKETQGLCTACAKPVTVGVEHRLGELATRSQPQATKQVEYIIPLAEVIAELKGAKSITTKAVTTKYNEVLARLGSEFEVLRNVPINAINDAGFATLAMAIERMRRGDVLRDPGFDGMFGTIKVFKSASELHELHNQPSLF
ncbi:MAG TPA: endonuclease Q family protein [Candidatus Saccharimonadales bacterium]|nr:endonuclease Q family protein [Candidatus Saccharimonadales bacterium]